MKIKGETIYKQWKLTLFQMNLRHTLKIEQGLLAQSYTFRESTGVSGLDEIEKWMTQKREKSITQAFQAMREAYPPLSSKVIEEEFPEII